MSMELPKTMTKGTPQSTANCTAVLFSKTDRLFLVAAICYLVFEPSAGRTLDKPWDYG